MGLRTTFQAGNQLLVSGLETYGTFVITDPPYNAVADGITDNTAAIQAAINDALKVNGEVVIPATQLPFAFSSTLSINGTAITGSSTAAITVRGLGSYASQGANPAGPQLVYTGTGTGDIFVVSGGFHHAFKDFTLFCSGPPTGGSAFNCLNTNNIEFADLLIHSCFNGILIQVANTLFFRRMYILPVKTGSWGIYCTNNLNTAAGGVIDLDHVFVFPTSTPTATLIAFMFGAGTASISARFCAGNACLRGWQFFTESGTSAALPSIIDLVNCIGENNVEYGFWFKESFDVNLVDVYANINGLFGILVDSQSQGVNITGGQVIANGQHGIYLKDQSRETHITGCLAMDNSGTAANTYSGINADAGAQHFSVVGCRCGGAAQMGGAASTTQKWGVSVQTGAGVGGTADFYIITNNDASGNVTAGVVDSGSGVNKVVNNNL